MLISSAGDIVAALAQVLGPGFVKAFDKFFPLIARFYVCVVVSTKFVIKLIFPEEKGAFSERAILRYWDSC